MSRTFGFRHGMNIVDEQKSNQDSLFAYTHITQLCKSADRISDTIDPYEISNNPNSHPSTNVAHDLRNAVLHLYEVQKQIYPTLTPTQTTVLTSYHNLLSSVSRYLTNAETVPQASAYRPHFGHGPEHSDGQRFDQHFVDAPK